MKATTKHTRQDRLLNELAEVLNDYGFYRRGQTLVRDGDGLEHVVELQKSRSGSEVCANCGVFIAGIHATLYSKPDPESPQVVDCCISARVEKLRSGGKDNWWNLKNVLDAEDEKALVRAISDSLVNLALPFLDRFSSRAAVAAFLEDPSNDDFLGVYAPAIPMRRLYAMLIFRQLGDVAAASAALCEAVRNASGTPLESTMQMFYERLESEDRDGREKVGREKVVKT